MEKLKWMNKKEENLHVRIKKKKRWMKNKNKETFNENKKDGIQEWQKKKIGNSNERIKKKVTSLNEK